MTVCNSAISFDFLDISKKMSLRHHFDYRLTSLAPPRLLPLVLPSPFSFLLWPNILSLLNMPVCHTEIPKWCVLFQNTFFFFFPQGGLYLYVTWIAASSLWEALGKKKSLFVRLFRISFYRKYTVYHSNIFLGFLYRNTCCC